MITTTIPFNRHVHENVKLSKKSTFYWVVWTLTRKRPAKRNEKFPVKNLTSMLGLLLNITRLIVVVQMC